MTRTTSTLEMFFKYPSIDNPKQFKYDIKKLLGVEKMPTVQLQGTVKVHGTNAGVTVARDGDVYCQSRTRMLSIQSDNAGFCAFAEENPYFTTAAQSILNSYTEHDYATFYGEWCGGNIQTGVGVSGMEKVFILFNVALRQDPTSPPLYIPSEYWTSDHSNNVYDINEFTTYNYSLDMSSQESWDALETLTLEVEENCPVAAVLNPDSSCKIGEGIVWTGEHKGTFVKFKAKGTKHQRGGGKPRKVSIGGGFTEVQVAAAKEFMEVAITTDRLLQGIEYMKGENLEITPKNTGQFLKWFANDVLKETTAELAQLSKLDVTWKQLCKQVNREALNFYQAYEEDTV